QPGDERHELQSLLAEHLAVGRIEVQRQGVVPHVVKPLGRCLCDLGIAKFPRCRGCGTEGDHHCGNCCFHLEVQCRRTVQLGDVLHLPDITYQRWTSDTICAGQLSWLCFVSW